MFVCLKPRGEVRKQIVFNIIRTDNVLVDLHYNFYQSTALSCVGIVQLVVTPDDL